MIKQPSKQVNVEPTLKQRWLSKFINVVSKLIFGWKWKLSQSTYVYRRCVSVELKLSFLKLINGFYNFTRILSYQIVFSVNPNSTLFQSYLRRNQHWQDDIDSTLISHRRTSRRYLNKNQCWNVAYLLRKCYLWCVLFAQCHSLL